MPHLPIKLFAAALVFGLAFAVGQAEAAPLPALNATNGLATTDTPNSALPVERAHYRGYRGYRGWGRGYPRYNYWNNYYYRPYYGYGYGYRPYWGYGYWNRPYYRRYW